MEFTVKGESKFVGLNVVLATCRARNLESTLESLAGCTLPANFLQTIIVENGTAEPSLQEVLSPFNTKLKISYRHCLEANKSGALNYVVQSLEKNTLLFLTDDDVKYDKDILIKYSQAAEGLETGYVFGGRVVPDCDSPAPPELLPYVTASMKGYPVAGKKFDPIRTPFIGSNWAVFSDDVKKFGGFDIRFGPGSKLRSTGQETQMMRRMFRAGYKPIFLESATVRHKVEPEHYTVKFVADRQFRNGVLGGLQCRLSQKRRLPPPKIIAVAIICTLATLVSPVASRLAPKAAFYKLIFTSHFARGYLRGWLSKNPK